MHDDDGPNANRLDLAPIAAVSEEQVQNLALPNWPVFALADANSTSGWLCGVGRGWDKVDAIRIDYCPPFAHERLLVQTQPGEAISDFTTVLPQLQADDDEGEQLDTGTSYGGPASTETIEVTVDGSPATALTRRAGSASAYCVRTQDVTVLIGVRSQSPNDIHLRQVSDLDPLKAARRQAVEHL